jgi:hypothetical protein
MRQNLEQTIQREREKAKNDERRENAKEFEKIYDLEEKLRISEVKFLQYFHRFNHGFR